MDDSNKRIVKTGTIVSLPGFLNQSPIKIEKEKLKIKIFTNLLLKKKEAKKLITRERKKYITQ